MNKFKKLLLTLAPLSAVAIATPIILTSCSTNASNPSNPGGGDSGTGEDGKIKGDSTNDKGYEPIKQGLYKSIEDAIKAGKPGEESTKFDEAFAAYKEPTDIDVKDAINIWSFNKWNEASQKENVTFASQLIDVNATSKKEADKNKWDISFKYKFQITTTIEGKTEDILAEKTYTASNIELKATIPFTTQASMLMVNGQSKLEEIKPKSFFAEEETNNDSDAVKGVKEFLKSETSNFDSKTNFKAFVDAKKIVGETTPPTPEASKLIWQAKEADKMAVVSADDPTTMVVTLSKGWSGNITKDAKLSVIKTALELETTKTFILSYIKDSKGWNIAFDNGTLDEKDKTMGTFNVTLSKEGEQNVTLKLVFKGVGGQ